MLCLKQKTVTDCNSGKDFNQLLQFIVQESEAQSARVKFVLCSSLGFFY